MRRTVEIGNLRRWLVDPFEEWPWYEGHSGPPLLREEVERAVAMDDTCGRPYSAPGDYIKWTRDKHVMRVAHFVVYGWPDPLDVEQDENGVFSLLDGYHRFAAAVYLWQVEEMRTIDVEFFGYVDEPLERFLANLDGSQGSEA